MSARRRKPAEPLQGDAGAVPVDEFAGQGGSYVIDPETGQRVLVERTRGRDEAVPQGDVSAPVAPQGDKE